MTESPPAQNAGASASRGLGALGGFLLLVWGAWWLDALVHASLRGAARTWMRIPAFGVDFTTQPDWAVRLWQQGVSPYIEEHMFHYPPLVIHLFRWVLLFDTPAALRIWIVALMSIVTLATWTVWRGRPGLGLGQVPFVLVLAGVLFSYPVIFALERANFDLITLAAMLAAIGCVALPLPGRHYLAGALLAVGPWVKIYPGLLALGLVALRWWRGLVGFVVGATVIGLLEPEELLKSLRLVRELIALHTARETALSEFLPWSHSLSMFARKALVASGVLPHAPILGRVPSSAFALLLLSPLLVWVTTRVYRTRSAEPLALPLLCWLVAAASFVPEVAHDYSLPVLPIAAVGVWSRRDSWPVHAAMGVGLLVMQPVALPLGGFVLLLAKVAFLAGVGGSIVARASDLGTAEVEPAPPEATATQAA